MVWYGLPPDNNGGLPTIWGGVSPHPSVILTGVKWGVNPLNQV
jgi:hypothetical protein